MFVAFVIIKEIGTNLLPVDLSQKSKGLVGMCPVFETYEQALAACPNYTGSIVEISSNKESDNENS